MPGARNASGAELAAEVRTRLNTIGDPCSVAVGSPMGLEEMGLVEAVDVDEAGHAEIRLRLTSPTCHMIGYFHVEAEKLALAVPGIHSASIETDTGLDWDPGMISPEAQERRERALARRGLTPARSF